MSVLSASGHAMAPETVAPMTAWPKALQSAASAIPCCSWLTEHRKHAKFQHSPTCHSCCAWGTGAESALSVSMATTSHRRELGASLQAHRRCFSIISLGFRSFLMCQCGTQITPLSSDQSQRSHDRKTFTGLMATGCGAEEDLKPCLLHRLPCHAWYGCRPCT